MTYRPKLVKRLRKTKAIFMALLIVLTISYILILIISKDFRSQIVKNAEFLVAFIVTWLCLLVSFSALFMDFILMKKSSDIAMELNDLEYLDKLTGLPNRYSIDRISQKYDSPAKLADLGLVLLELRNIKEINKVKGRAGGDKIISDFCAILESVGTQYGLIGRNSGNEFLVVIEGCDANSIEFFIGELERRIHNHNTISPEAPIELSYASVLEIDHPADHFYTLITNVYRAFEENPKTLC